MVSLTPENIITIHEKVEAAFNVYRGVKDPGLVKAVAERPDTVINDYEPYDNIHLKAASIMEGIIRWHPFFDGNKRTALLAVYAYLEINGYSITYPLSAVRFTVEIARKLENDPQSNERLIREIAAWLKKLSSRYKMIANLKRFRHVMWPINLIQYQIKLNQKQQAARVLIEWLALDLEESYQKEIENTVAFIGRILVGEYSGILSGLKTK